jgi:hypothetical protein
MKLKIFLCQFPNPLTLRVSGMGGYTSKWEKSQNHCTLVCSTTVCPVHNFPPPSELLVCYQPHRQEVMPGQKSIYETFLAMTDPIYFLIRDGTLLYAGVDYKLTLCRLQDIYHGQPYARVDLNPMPESTLFPSHGLIIRPEGSLLYCVV